MSKTFRRWPVDQVQLLPASVGDFVPAGHVAHFVRDMAREQLDLSEIIESYTELRGYPPFDPVMMTALLLYGYSQGVYSSRRMARACEERLDFLAVTAMNRPDHRTINKFRKRHLSALSGLFVQVLKLCQKAGLADLGHVALDGTKIKANASRHKAMSYDRMLKTGPELKAQVDAWLARAEQTDALEDAELGEARGDEMPDWMADKQKRIAKIEEAKTALEAEARAQAEAKARAATEKQRKRKRKGGPGKPTKGKAQPEPPAEAQGESKEEPKPKAKAQRNFTDPESRIMKGPDGFLQGYNAQAAVDAKAQIIVAHGLSDCSADSGQLEPMFKEIRVNTGRNPAQFSADAGYCSDANLAALDKQKINAFIAPGRQRHGRPPGEGGAPGAPGTRVERMRAKLRKDGFDSPYRLRKQTVEPVFGQIKHARGFRQFLLRGRDKVASEWAMICTVHNLLKLATYRPALA
ncbi:IS1182 family transposase [Aurantimonas sp. A3-2-R12]|uniref:IS1182 family transposase n=1 Tax=Aurantimonas sp. A3-2-R12 TaxID=3114362 RepID=UPI002E1757EB|nr:IS1182 family transposase [Aurantimonas sp. A3-2-R12]